jgi:hypothetical protein
MVFVPALIQTLLGPARPLPILMGVGISLRGPGQPNATTQPPVGKPVGKRNNLRVKLNVVRVLARLGASSASAAPSSRHSFVVPLLAAPTLMCPDEKPPDRCELPLPPLLRNSYRMHQITRRSPGGGETRRPRAEERGASPMRRELSHSARRRQVMPYASLI